MSKIKKLAGETVLYGLGSMVPRMLNFLLLPLHTKSVFDPAQYGVITKLLAIVGFLNVVYMFGMETTYFRFASKPGEDPKRIFNLAQTAVLVVSVSLSVIFIIFAKPIASSLDIQGHSQFIIWLTLVMLIDAVVAIPFARLRLLHRPILFSAGKIINVLILIGLNYYFLILNKEHYDPSIGVGYVFLSTLIANSFYLIFLFRSLVSWRPVFDGKVLSTMFNYAFPIMLTGLAGMTNEMFSRLTLEWWLPPNFYKGQSDEYALGVFGACYKYAVLMNLAVQAFRFAAEPFFFSNAIEKNSTKLFAQVNHYFIIVCCILLFGVGTNLDILKWLTGREYWQGLNIVPILLLGYLFLGVYYNFSIWFKLTDKTYFGTIITLGGAIITILLNYILIPIAGYTGSSWATLLCYLLMAGACYWLGQRYYPIPYKIIKGVAYIVVTVILLYGVKSVTLNNQWLATAFHIAALCLYILFVYLIERRDLQKLPIETPLT